MVFLHNLEASTIYILNCEIIQCICRPMINGPIVCLVGLYEDRWRGMILAQITTALT